MYQSPLHYCRPLKRWVALDVQVEQCHVLNACPLKQCPYGALFEAVGEERAQVVARMRAATEPAVLR